MEEYDKLVRDKIPDIIHAKKKTPVTHTVFGTEYIKRLDQKLKEEVGEYLEKPSQEELADILEVIYTIAHVNNISREDLEKIRELKAEDRGGFKKRIVLERIEEKL